MPYVTAPASAPSSSMRSPDRRALRPVNSDNAQPTANSATLVRPTVPASAASGATSSHGSSGRHAPAANETNDAAATANPTRGRFRAFLRAVCADFLANRRDRANALKRGGGRPTVPIDADAAEGRYGREPAHELSGSLTGPGR